MKKPHKLITFILLLSSFNTFAGGALTTHKITKLAFQNEDLMMYADNWGNPNNCQRTNAVILKKSDQNFDKAYSLILAAFMSGKKITAYSDGCYTFDERTYNYIRGFKYLVVE